jgi:hypothetical protein
MLRNFVWRDLIEETSGADGVWVASPSGEGEGGG